MNALPPPSFASRLGSALNALSERIAGRERGFRYGESGQTRLPAIAPDSFIRSDAERTRLANTRIYLLPGHPWPGVAQNGAAWLGPWQGALEALGAGRVTPIRYTEGWSALGTVLRAPLEPIFHTQEKRVLAKIRADLAAHPLKPGERVVLVGHSYGAHMGALASDQLRQSGVPVEGLVMIETRLPDIGKFAKHVPRLPEVIEIENDPLPVTPPAGTRYKQLVFPTLSHMDMVLAPSPEMLGALLGEIADG